jgi:Putative arginyl-tRNA:protein arginylyltransferase
MNKDALPGNISDPFPDLFASPCGYFESRTSHYTVFRIPSPEDACDITSQEYNDTEIQPDDETCQQMVFDSLLAGGFRRADDFLYRADCPDCRKCVPIRISVPDFRPSKSQRRTLRQNADVSVHIVQTPSDFVTDEKIALYGAYDKRHNPQSKKSSDEYRAELMQMNGIRESASGIEQARASYSGTFNMEYRLTPADSRPGTLIGVGIVDAGTGALSSNYFYYDISEETMKRSIGTYSVLREIDLCRHLRFNWYYLGYWIADCNKMVYKSGFIPHQLLVNGRWQSAENQ